MVKISTGSLTKQVHFVFLKTCNAMQSASIVSQGGTNNNNEIEMIEVLPLK